MNRRLMMAGIIAMAVDGMPRRPQRHYIPKETQPEDEKNKKLATAKEKRERKALLKEQNKYKSIKGNK